MAFSGILRLDKRLEPDGGTFNPLLPIMESRVLTHLQSPQQYLQFSQRYECIYVSFVLSGQRSDAAVASEQSRLEGRVVGAMLQFAQSGAQVIHEGAVAAVVEVDGSHFAMVKQIVLLVKVTVDKAECFATFTQVQAHAVHFADYRLHDGGCLCCA
jgi:hypothetical protein